MGWGGRLGEASCYSMDGMGDIFSIDVRRKIDEEIVSFNLRGKGFVMMCTWLC